MMKKRAYTTSKSNDNNLKNLLLKKEEELRKTIRQLEIETVLERVRSLTMVMKRSDDLSEIILTVYKELRQLDMTLTRTLIWLFSENPDMFEVWVADTEADKTSFVMKQEVEHPYHKRMFQQWRKRKSKWVYINEGEAKKDLDDYLFTRTAAVALPEEVKAGIRAVDKIVNSFSFHNFGCLQADGEEKLSDENFEILDRFAKEFDLAYTRFLDLQNAEALAREAQIETALERVRSASMAMHQSEELNNVIGIVFKELTKLELPLTRVAIWIFDREAGSVRIWIANPEGESGLNSFFLENNKFPNYKGVLKAWKEGKDFWEYQLKGKEKKDWGNYLFNHTEFSALPKEAKEVMMAAPKYTFHASLHDFGCLHTTVEEPLTNEQLDIYHRFGKVFNQTYTRFLDLQKAEAQAREAQIEAALERVRARSMAMHKSDELQEVINQLFVEIESLGVQMGSSYIVTDVDKDITEGVYIWLQNNVNLYAERVHLPYLDHPMFHNFYKAWLEKTPFYTEIFNRKEKNRLFNHLFKQSPQLSAIPEERKKHVLDGSGFTRSVVIYNNAAFVIQKYDDIPYKDEEVNIQKRFGSVFEQTFTRFLDLKKAETQAREAQVEASLERIRAKAMAMHSSEDISEATGVVFSELENLGIETLRCGIGVMSDKHQMYIWTAISKQKANVARIIGSINMKGHKVMAEAYRSWQNQDTMYCYELEGMVLKSYYKALSNDPNYPIPELNSMPKKHTLSTFNFKEGLLFTFTNESLSEESTQILGRFTNVFAMTYRRYLDLVQAEAQAREAQIEAALERIRAKALAMQSSTDLHDVSIVLREQMGLLGQPELESSIVHLYNSNQTLESWYTFRSTETNSPKVVTDVAFIPVDSCEYIKETLEKYKSEETEYTIVSKGKKLHDWYNVMVKVAPETIEYDKNGKMLVPDILYYHHSKFSGGALLLISNQPPSEEAEELQRRAARVFNFAYQRFLDLKKAEEQAREARKQASLDRVRGEIASMRSKDDLGRITPVIWKELTALGVPFIRCGVFIMDNINKVIQSYLSTPDGRSLGVYNLPYEATEIATELVRRWKNKKAYKEHWDKKQFIKFVHTMSERGLIKNQQAYQGDAKPPESLDLHFVPFKQGMLYVGNINPLSENEMLLVKSLAESFSIAYARYEDFNQLEHAKNQIEEALSELRSTQTQLIHAEKMASLGELTAGIAHEIQNPLNFVNNFSEVSKELIEEMQEEMGSGNMDEVKEISGDIKQNLDKINHHGQRASSIVKGMLEHSRTGKKEKELTDINRLADEYLRLAYHGLRAKDKSFNAEFITELDDKLPKIRVISQDIGRVLLNLVNNAFYAVSSKAKRDIDGYVPTVILKTKNKGKQIEIRVKDNADGIPSHIIDKIFQPFFTTKPTGQGTGLGLSLSYDIVTKGHNGNLEVDTMKGLGTEFIIILPIN